MGRLETSWNFVLADREGNIGYQMSGLMPIRREGVSGFIPLPGWEEKNDWQGFHQPEDLPRCLNPECGYFVTSNQDLNEYGKVDPINVGMGPYRSDRIAIFCQITMRLPVKPCTSCTLMCIPSRLRLSWQFLHHFFRVHPMAIS